MDVVFYRLFLRLGTLVWKGIMDMSSSTFLFLMFFCSCLFRNLSGPAKGLIPAVLMKLSMFSPPWARFALLLLSPPARLHRYGWWRLLWSKFCYGFFCYLWVMASKAFLAPKSGVPDAAPKATAFPPDINVGNNTAKGKIPPLWHIFFSFWQFFVFFWARCCNEWWYARVCFVFMFFWQTMSWWERLS